MYEAIDLILQQENPLLHHSTHAHISTCTTQLASAWLYSYFVLSTGTWYSGEPILKCSLCACLYVCMCALSQYNKTLTKKINWLFWNRPNQWTVFEQDAKANAWTCLCNEPKSMTQQLDWIQLPCLIHHHVPIKTWTWTWLGAAVLCCAAASCWEQSVPHCAFLSILQLVVNIFFCLLAKKGKKIHGKLEIMLISVCLEASAGCLHEGKLRDR